MRLLVLETFEIENRGTPIVVASATNLPVGKVLRATVTNPDGSQFQTDAFKEWLLRRNPAPVEQEAYLLRGVSIGSVRAGAEVECVVPQQP